jgi:hypothetical protein
MEQFRDRHVYETPEGKTAGERTRSVPCEFEIVLGTGFHGHTVVIAVDGRDVYRRSGVATSPVTLRADAFDAIAACSRVHIAVCVTPGNLGVTVECNLSTHRHVLIGLLGEATLSLETYL